MNIQLLDSSLFDSIYDGKHTKLYTLKSGNGLILQVTNFGARVVSLWTADRKGDYTDIVLGRKTIGEYTEPIGERYLGSVIGRYGNRIAKGEFSLDGQTYHLPINNNGQSLHGGIKAFDMVVWDVLEHSDNHIKFEYTSSDGEEGFPGTLKVTMTYTLTANNEFKIEYNAVTDKSTVVNLTHHSYFNLKGEGSGTAMDHELTIYADKFIPIDEVSVPLGNLAKVDNTPFDFRQSKKIGERIDMDDTQLKNGSGYDHCWVVNKQQGENVTLAATVYESVSGRLLEVYTDQPGIQFYAGNWFDGSGMGKYGESHRRREGIALETQKYPDSPNHPNFPSTRLNLSEKYTHICIYKFSTK